MAETRRSQTARRLRASAPAALDALAEAVESGAGLPETARRAAAALGASVALIDSRGAVLAVAAGSPARGARAALEGGRRHHDRPARRRRRWSASCGSGPRGDLPEPALLRMVTTLLALEVERTRAPERAGEAAVGSFVNAVLDGEIADRRDLIARGKELGVDLENGGARAGRAAASAPPAEGDWQARALTIVGRAARGVAPGALASLRGEHIAVIVPGADEALSRRAAEAVLRAVDDAMPGFAAVVGRSRVAVDPMDMHRAAGEALLAANVASPDAESRTPAAVLRGHRRLPAAAARDERRPGRARALLHRHDRAAGRLRRAVRHRAGGTLETFLANDGSMAATYKQLFTHRHTIRYRLERIKELTGLDVELHRRPRAPRASA